MNDRTIRVGGLWGNHQAGSIWSAEGISPTLTDGSTGGYGMPLILQEEKNVNEESKPIKIGNTTEGGKSQCNGVFSPEEIYPNICAGVHGNCNPSVMCATDEPFIVASRGRNPEDPSDRKAGCPTEQRYEPNSQGLSNTLTTVQKDNLVAEPVIIDDIYNSREDRVYSRCSPTLRSERHGLKVAEPSIVWPSANEQGYKLAHEGDGVVMQRPQQRGSSVMEQSLHTIRAQNAGDSGVVVGGGRGLRIRRLTPKECFRLMGFDDKDIDVLEENGISNTQLYKMAGNSIVVDVLEHLLGSLLLNRKDTNAKQPSLWDF